MATVIQIKRNTGTSAPTTGDLAEGELAYTQDRTNDGASSKLYIESVDSVGGAVIHEVGGKYYTDIIDGDTPTPANFKVGNGATSGAQIELYEDTDNGSNYTGFKAPDALAGDIIYTLPLTDGSNDQVLKTDGAGTLSWEDTQVGGLSDVNVTSPASGQLLIYDGTDSWDNVDVTGDVTITNLGVTTLGAGTVEFTMFDAATVQTSAELVTPGFSDDDVTVLTAAAVQDRIDTTNFAQDLDITDGTTTSAVLIDSQTLTIQGTANETTVEVSGQVFTVGLPDSVSIATELTAASAIVSDLTDNRVVIAGTSGALEDDANFTFDGTTLTLVAAMDITGDLDVDNININGDTISNTNTDSNINIVPNGVGEVVVGTGAANATVTSSGAHDLILDTNSGTNSGTITITDGVDGNISVTPNGNGEVVLSTAAVSDLTDNRVVIAGASGAIEDDANLTFDGTDFVVGGASGVTIKGSGTDVGDVNIASGNFTVDASTGDVIVGGNLTVQGTTTTVDSTTVSIADPVFEIGDDAADDNLDRGIKFLYNDGAAKIGFFGFDDSTGKFIALSDATDSTSTFSGTALPAVFGNVEVGTITSNTNKFTVDANGNTLVAGTLDVTGATNINDTTSSTNTTSGALIVDGGVGIAENLNVGGTFGLTGAFSLTDKITLYNNAEPSDGQLLIGNTSTGVFDAAVLTEGEGIDITNAGGSITISGEDASAANKGIASFAASYFTVTTGDVAINDATTSTKGIASYSADNFTLTSGNVTITGIDGGTY